MLGQVTGGPADAVFAVQLGGQRSSCQPAVEALLEAPHGELAVAIEAESEQPVADHVVHRSKPVRRRPAHIP